MLLIEWILSFNFITKYDGIMALLSKMLDKVILVFFAKLV